MSARAVLAKGEERLAAVGILPARREAEELLAEAWKIPRLSVHLRADPPGPEVVDRFLALVDRRATRAPIQYVTGHAEFLGRTFQTGAGALVPRPDTETLVEAALAALKGSPPGRALRVLELGTGSGAVIVSLNRALEGMKHGEWVATDISIEARARARSNAEARGCADSIRFLQGDLFASIASEKPFDLILFNPPYIPTSDIEVLAPEIKDWEPRVALDGGPDGVAFSPPNAPPAPGQLVPGVRALFLAGGLKTVSVENDFSRTPRVVAVQVSP